MWCSSQEYLSLLVLEELLLPQARDLLVHFTNTSETFLDAYLKDSLKLVV